MRRIKDIAELRSGDAITSEDIAPSGDYPVYGGNGLRGYTSSCTHKGCYVLIGRQGALCGNINYAEGEFWASEHAVVVSPIKRCNTLWLGETLRAMNLNQHSNAAAQPGLAVERVKRLHFPVPTFTEQNVIAAYLDNACKAIDGAIDAKQKQLESLADLRKSIIHKAVTRGLDDSVEMKPSGVDWLGEIPAHWGAPRLKDIADIRYGLGQPPAESEDGIPMVRATNVDAGRIVDRDLLCIDKNDLPLGRNPYLKANEIIVVRSGAYTGDSAIIPPEYAGAVAGYDMVVTVSKAVPEFVAYALLSYYVLDAQTLLLTLRAAQPHLNAEQLGSIRLLVPDSRDEQRAIAGHVAEKIEGIEQVHGSLTDQIRTLRDYRKSLIHECVTGKRRITDADIQKVEAHV